MEDGYTWKRVIDGSVVDEIYRRKRSLVGNFNENNLKRVKRGGGHHSPPKKNYVVVKVDRQGGYDYKRRTYPVIKIQNKSEKYFYVCEY